MCGRTKDEHDILSAVMPRRWQLRPLSKEALQERMRSLSPLSQQHVRDAHQREQLPGQTETRIPQLVSV